MTDPVALPSSGIYRPRIYIDGDQWCALYGDNIHDGVCGFGESPAAAMAAFDEAWAKKLPSANSDNWSMDNGPWAMPARDAVAYVVRHLECRAGNDPDFWIQSVGTSWDKEAPRAHFNGTCTNIQTLKSDAEALIEKATKAGARRVSLWGVWCSMPPMLTSESYLQPRTVRLQWPETHNCNAKAMGQTIKSKSADVIVDAVLELLPANCQVGVDTLVSLTLAEGCVHFCVPSKSTFDLRIDAQLAISKALCRGLPDVFLWGVSVALSEFASVDPMWLKGLMASVVLLLPKDPQGKSSIFPVKFSGRMVEFELSNFTDRLELIRSAHQSIDVAVNNRRPFVELFGVRVNLKVS